MHYTIDKDDHICSVSEDWDSFAVENGAPGLTSDVVVGMLLWDLLGIGHTEQIYRALVARVRERKRASK